MAAVSRRFRAVLMEPVEYNIVAPGIKAAEKQMKQIAARRSIKDMEGKLDNEHGEKAILLYVIEHPLD